jgi:hypothetical protein
MAATRLPPGELKYTEACEIRCSTTKRASRAGAAWSNSPSRYTAQCPEPRSDAPAPSGTAAIVR